MTASQPIKRPKIGERPPVRCGYCYVNATCSGGCYPRRDTHAEWTEANAPPQYRDDDPIADLAK